MREQSRFTRRMQPAGRRILASALCVAAIGCAGHFERQMDTDVHQFVGQDIHAAITKLGYPTKEETIAGDHLYRWSINGGSTGVGTAVAGVAVVQSTPNGCAVDLVVNDAGTVTEAKWSGDRRGCSDIQDRIEQ